MDITLTIDGIKKQFNLAQQNSQKLWKVEEQPVTPLVPGVAGASNYTALPQERRCAFEMSDWSGGIGQRDFKVADKYAYGETIDSRYYSSLILAPKFTQFGTTVPDAPSDFCEHGAYLYMIAGHKVYKTIYTDSDWTLAYTGGGDLTQLIRYDDYLYALCLGDHYSYCSLLGVWTESTLPYYPQYACICSPMEGAKMPLAGASLNTVMLSVDPLNTSADKWTDPPFYVGHSTIHSIFTLSGGLFVASNEGIFYIPPEGKPQCVVAAIYDDQYNFYHTTVLNGCVYLCSKGSLMELSTYYTLDTITPEMLDSSTNSMKAVMLGVIGCDNSNLYVTAMEMITATTYNTHLLAGRKREDSWSWHPIYKVESPTTITCLDTGKLAYFDYSPRLWLSTYTSGTGRTYHSLLADNPLKEVGFTGGWGGTQLSQGYDFTSTGYAVTSWDDRGYRTWNKLYTHLTVEAYGCSADVNIKFYYRSAEGASWSAAIATVTTNGIQTIQLPSPISCKKIQLKIELNSNSSKSSPQLKMFSLQGILQPEITRTIEFTVILGQSGSRKPSTDLTFLRTGRTTTGLVTLIDNRLGIVRYVTFLVGSPAEMEMIDPATKQPTYVAKVMAQEVDWTA